LKALLDPETIEKKAEFQDLFYNLALKQFTDFIDNDFELGHDDKN